MELIKVASVEADAPPASDMYMEYFAGREASTGVILIFHIHHAPTYSGPRKLTNTDLTSDHMSIISCNTQITGILSDGGFFAGVPGKLITVPHSSIRFGNFNFQGSFGTSTYEAITKLSSQLSYLPRV